MVRFEASEKATVVSADEEDYYLKGTAAAKRGKKERSAANPAAANKGKRSRRQLKSDSSEDSQGSKVDEEGGKANHRQVHISIRRMAPKTRSSKSAAGMVALSRKRKSKSSSGGGGSKVSRKRKGGVSKKPRVVKGRLQIRVRGYAGVQKIAPSTLIPFLPTVKLRAAAKKVLSRSSAVKRSGPKKKRKVSRKRSSAGAKKKKRRTKKRKV